MRLLLIIVWAVIAAPSAYAKEYGNYDARRILTVAETPSGKRHGIDMPYLDQMVNDLATHAKNYPPNFDSDADRQRATRDAGMLAGILDILVNGPNPHPEILFRAALVNSFGHNLKIPGAAEKASSIFQRLLVISPDHPRTNQYYGMFLAGTGKFRESIPFLEKALAAGFVDASYSLGMVHLSLGDKVKALEYLENYQKRNPNDANVVRLIEGIRDGKVELKRNSVETRALNETDYGTYAVVDAKGQVTTKVFRVSQRNSEWIVEDKRPDGSWVAVTCEADCKLHTSTEGDVQRFFNASALAEIGPNCVHSKAFAFCAYSLKNNPTFRGYVFVALTEKSPIVLRLSRVVSDKTSVPNPAASSDATR